MKKSVKLFAILSVMAFSVFGFAGCGENQTAGGSGDDKATKVTIGTLDLVNGDLIAQQEQWYENELGVEVKIVKFDSGKDMNAAIAANAVDIAQEGTSPAALAISSGQDIEVIWIGDILGTAETLVARNGSGISSVKDLVGKKVGTPFSSTAHYSLLNALKLEGVNENDVEILDLQPDDIFAAWQRGDIDAAYIWFPVLERLLENGTSITDSYQLAQRGVVTADLNVVKKSFAEKNPEIVTKFVELQLRANDVIKNDVDKTAKDISAQLGITEDEAKSQITQYQYLNAEEQIDQLDNHMPEILKSTADFLVEQKSIKSAPDLEKFKNSVNSEFVKNASKQ